MVVRGDRLQDAHGIATVRPASMDPEKVRGGFAQATDGVRKAAGGGEWSDSRVGNMLLVGVFER